MNKLTRTFISLIAVLTLSSCASGLPYTYKPALPNEVPATIQFKAQPQPNLSVYVQKINGDYIFNYGKGPASQAVQNDVIKISPFPTKMVLWVHDNFVDGETTIALEAKSGERYTLDIVPGEPQIKDSAGNIVAKGKYTIEKKR